MACAEPKKKMEHDTAQSRDEISYNSSTESRSSTVVS